MGKDISEYTLLLIKPDGIESGKTDFILKHLEPHGIIEICRNSLHLCCSQICDLFTSHSNDDVFRRYMARGEVTAIIIKGDNSYEKVFLLKPKIREECGAKSIIENIFHSPECGNEYDCQLRCFFPNKDYVQFAPFSDLYVKINLPGQKDEFYNKLDDLQNNTCIKAIGLVFNSDYFNFISKNLYSYYNENFFRIFPIVGLEYMTQIHENNIKIVGYYPVGSNSILSAHHNRLFYYDVKELIHMINSSGGVSCIGHINNRYTINKENIIQLRDFGVQGALVYHPQYILSETEITRKTYLENGMFILGGSGGISEIGRFGVSYALFNKLYKAIYGADYV